MDDEDRQKKRKNARRLIRKVGKRKDKTKENQSWEKEGNRIAQEEGGRQKWEQGWRVRGGRGP